MTRSGHNVVMKSKTRRGVRAKLPGTRANIAVLKANLSRYLRKVQAGEELIVMDRATAIAKIVPYRLRKDDFITIPAKRPFRWAWDRPPVKLRKRLDPLPYLLRDREDPDWLKDLLKSPRQST